MEIDALGQTNTESKSASSLAKLSENLDSFLTILTTQLQNQDPLSPLDTHEFTNQLVLFAGVEQQIQQNNNLEDLIALQRNNVATGAVSYIGKQVEAEGRTTTLKDDEATFIYTLPEDANAATLTVVDSSGDLVLLTRAETAAGRHEFVFDGKNSLGNTLPEGAYTIEVTAADANDQPIDVSYTIFGTVTGVDIEEGEATLRLDDITVPLSQVTRIRGSVEEPAES